MVVKRDMTAKVLLGLMILLYGLTTHANQADNEDGTVAQRNADVHLRGVVMPAQKVKFSFAQAGVITQMASGGSLVAKGQLLLKLDDKKALALLEQSRAELRAAKSALASAQHSRDKSARLVEENILSDIALTEAEFTVTAALEKVAVAKAKLAVVKRAVAECTIVAPFDGAVAATAASIGEWAKAGEPVLEFVNFNTLKLSLDIPPNLAEGLFIGMTTAIFESGQQVGEAMVKTIYPVIDPASGLRRIIWQILPDEGKLLSGRYVSLANWQTDDSPAGATP